MSDRRPPPTDDWWITAPLAEICQPISASEGRTLAPAESAAVQNSFTRQRKKRPPTTPARRLAVIEAVKGGATYAEAAVATDVSESEVGRIAKEAGVARGRGRPKGGKTCAVPTCDNQLAVTNKTGVCRIHHHADGYCGCPRCRETS